MKSLGYTMLMLLVFLFVFGMIFTGLAEQNEGLARLQLGSIGGAMWFMLLYGTFMDDVSSALNELFAVAPAYAFFFLLFIFLSNLTLLNMLIGVLVEVISNVSRDERDNAERQELED